MSFAIEISNLNKSYNKQNKSLDDINFSVERGSFFALLGPNGAGKSTLINILSRIVIKDSGKINISGIDFDKSPEKTAYKLGIVPQELVLDPFFTVYETLEIYASYYGIKKSDRKTKEILEALSLSDKINSRSRLLSGGMKRRLLIAKALIHNPEILILDEPTAGVDIELRNQLYDYIKYLNKDLGITIILTTHYLQEAEDLCNQIAIINKGKLILNKPKNQLIDSFREKDLIIDFSTEDNNDILSNQTLIQNKFANCNINIKSFSKNRIIIEYNDSSDIYKSISLLKDNNIDIKDISTRNLKLEDIFCKIIK